MNEIISSDTYVSVNQNHRIAPKQPIGEKLITGTELEARSKMESETEVGNLNKQIIKQIAAMLSTSQESETSAISSDSNVMSIALAQEANKSPIKTPHSTRLPLFKFCTR